MHFEQDGPLGAGHAHPLSKQHERLPPERGEVVLWEEAYSIAIMNEFDLKSRLRGFIKYLFQSVIEEAPAKTKPKPDQLVKTSEEVKTPTMLPSGYVTKQPVPSYEWRVIGKSVRGASHIRSGLPNQDAMAWAPESGSGSPLILAVADGHGSSKSFRSDIGSKFAVQATLAECKELLEGQPDMTNLSAIKRTAEERLPQAIVRHWERLVREHVSSNPVLEEELDKAVNEASTPVVRETLAGNPLMWYGATIIGALVTKSCIILLQCGDGEVLSVSSMGEVSRPMRPDERLLGNETTSLCSPDAWREFRFAFQAQSESSPALILLSTDGYINSFVQESEFLKVGPDFLRMIRKAGLSAVDEKLDEWLTEASQSGSGDDITLGLVSRIDKEETSEEEPPTTSEETHDAIF